jgi:hypothetical protein
MSTEHDLRPQEHTPAGEQESQASQAARTSETGRDRQEDTASVPDWMDELPGELRRAGALAGFENVESLARAHLETLENRDSIPDSAQDYELEIPEDLAAELPPGLLDAPSLDEFRNLAHELGLSGRAAGRLAVFEAGRLAQAAQQAKAAQSARREQWRAQLKRELPGGALKTAANQAAQALKRFGGQEAVRLMEETGLGDHPALVRTFLGVARAVSEDSLKDAQAASGPRSAADVLYGKG